MAGSWNPLQTISRGFSWIANNPAVRQFTNTLASIKLPSITFQNPIPILQSGQAPIQKLLTPVVNAIARPFQHAGLNWKRDVQTSPIGNIFRNFVPSAYAPQIFKQGIAPEVQPKALYTPETNISSMAGSFDVSQLAGLAQGAVSGLSGLAGGSGGGKSTPVAVGRKYILMRNNATGKLHILSRTPRRKYAPRQKSSGIAKMMEYLLPIVLISSLHK